MRVVSVFHSRTRGGAPSPECRYRLDRNSAGTALVSRRTAPDFLVTAFEVLFAYRRKHKYSPCRLYPASKSRICCGVIFHEEDILISLLVKAPPSGGILVPAEELISQLSASVSVEIITYRRRIVNVSPANGPLRLRITAGCHPLCCFPAGFGIERQRAVPVISGAFGDILPPHLRHRSHSARRRAHGSLQYVLPSPAAPSSYRHGCRVLRSAIANRISRRRRTPSINTRYFSGPIPQISICRLFRARPRGAIAGRLTPGILRIIS